VGIDYSAKKVSFGLDPVEGTNEIRHKPYFYPVILHRNKDPANSGKGFDILSTLKRGDSGIIENRLR